MSAMRAQVKARKLEFNLTPQCPTMTQKNKSDLRSILLIWLVVVAIDYCLRASMIFSSLIISEKVSA